MPNRYIQQLKDNLPLVIFGLSIAGAIIGLFTRLSILEVRSQEAGTIQEKVQSLEVRIGSLETKVDSTNKSVEEIKQTQKDQTNFLLQIINLVK